MTSRWSRVGGNVAGTRSGGRTWGGRRNAGNQHRHNLRARDGWKPALTDALVVLKPLRRDNLYPMKVRMKRVNQPITFGGRQNGWSGQQRGISIADKLVPNLTEVGRRRKGIPIRGQLLDSQMNAGKLLRDLSHGKHQIVWPVAWVQMGQVLKHRQREIFRRVHQAGSWGRPAPAEAVAAFPIQRVGSKSVTEQTIDPAQLTPPYPMRPRRFSTCRAPSSVSIKWSGTAPPRTMLGRFIQSSALARLPMK